MIETVICGILAALTVLMAFRMFYIQRAAKQREELFQIVTENAADMIALVDMKGHRLYNSPAYKRILGYSAPELGETSAFEQIHPDDRLRVLEAAREARESGVGKRLEYRIRHKDGTWRVLESIASTIRDDKGEVAKLVIVNRDITERKRAEEQLEHNSFHDALTSLPNRRLFLDRLQQMFARAQRYPDYQYAVLLLDIDRFKAFNDSMGNAAGDQLIVEFGRRLSTCLRQDDTVARPGGGLQPDHAVSRLGGNEFAVLLDGLSDASDAMRVAQRFQASVAKPFVVNGREVLATASVGIAVSTNAHERVEDLLQEADVAMRRAKGLGGARCEVFDEAMHTSALRRLRLEGELKDAVENSQFRVHYQPVVDLESKRVLGFEALLRWQHPERGLISPAKFLECAEDAGLLVSIGQWLFAEVCRQMRSWQSMDSAMGSLYVSVNLSSRQLADSGLVGNLRSVLQETGMQPAGLRLELNESVAMTNASLTANVISQVRQLGVGVILDGFGTGPSSLRQLRQLSVEALKIDRSLVNELPANRGRGDLVELIITLAHKLGVKAVAEGVETANQLERLRELGCDLGQGHLFSRPLEAKAAQQFVGQQRASGKHAGLA